MGTRGPAPRREEERRRRNAPAHPIVKMGRDELQALPFEVDLEPAVPEIDTRDDPNSDWHPVVRDFWHSLETDPARAWMTSADWQIVRIHCEAMSRDLRPQVVGVTEDGSVVRDIIPIKGANLGAYQKLFAMIGLTEANRLRLQKEITLFPATTDVGDGENVVDIASARQEGVQ